MKIWVDADACPNVVKDILFRAANRVGVKVTLVANQFIRVPPSPHIKSIQVESGFDVADNYIVQQAEVGDLVITADIPLADELITKGAHALNPRGEMYTKDTIKQRLQMRDFMETMRSSGIQTGGPAALNQADRQNFANKLDSFLAKNFRRPSET
ncbi:YaiI/YqxD family protein [uncultured Photobacterium sp.]|uniref:YaiI/YqxD family protein n=1 Tax=uncultured Photobacterium sp. TaxID=173973 RepID=UPI00260E3306|nr:YaiI/YqxD family protein [uncultured Photobacterium sp.]